MIEQFAIKCQKCGLIFRVPTIEDWQPLCSSCRQIVTDEMIRADEKKRSENE